jgi:sterol desaturase/sphingolipid hydroxylase (fatty acid hydroxylase superfamily)
MAFNRVNYWLGFALDFTVSLATIGIGVAAGDAPWPVPLAALAAGAFAFTLYEYALHRWLYHVLPTAVRRIHRDHHGEPRRLVGAPFFFSLTVTALTWALASLAVSRATAAVFAGTILFAYAYHGAVHHLVHARRFRGAGLFARLQRHHLVHHAARYGDVNFGVTTTIWDRVFGTCYVPAASRRAPSRSAARSGRAAFRRRRRRPPR